YLPVVGGNHTDGVPVGLGRDPPPPRSMGPLVENNATQATRAEEARRYLRRVLADARREHETVEAAQGGCQSANLACGTEYEQVHGFACMRIVVGEQCTHVA